jgi:hypothetical protein
MAARAFARAVAEPFEGRRWMPHGSARYARSVAWPMPAKRGLPVPQRVDARILPRRARSWSISMAAPMPTARSPIPLTHGAHLAAGGDVVVVTVNHRLGPLGYAWLRPLDAQAADSGNLGQLDLILALHGCAIILPRSGAIPRGSWCSANRAAGPRSPR